MIVKLSTEDEIRDRLDAMWGKGFWDGLSESDRASRMSFLHRTERANAQKNDDLAFAIETLRKHGIFMKVHGCGCCGSPSVNFGHEGRVFEHDDASFDTDAK